ncbi:MAG: geranylgeranylglycerol-phosphate geranylgeranyltransferase [archaeon]|nr:geranylgeranylglycerol-phosphate geranylgeranyltransferase [archaeon]
MDANKYVSLLRPLNCFISSFGVFVGFAVATGGQVPNAMLLFAMASAFLITGAGNAVNDYYDSEIDARLGKARANPAKNILIYSLALFAIGIILASPINTQALAIAIAVSMLLFAYSAWMQNYKFLGNWVVALGTAMTLFFGASISGNYGPIILPAGSALFANAAREIIKDKEDVAGDRGIKKTLPMMVGKGVLIIVPALYLAAIALAIAAWALGIMKGPYYIALVLGAGFLFYRSWKLLEEEKAHEAQEHSKYGMILALLAFLGGIL